MKCPLCNAQTKIFEKIPAASIISLWGKRGVNVKYIIKDDSIAKIKCNDCGLGFYYPPCPGDDGFYGELAKWDWYYKHPGKSEYDFSAKKIVSGMEVIDVGCGIGEFYTYLPKHVKFLGVELSSKSVEIATKLGRNVMQMDITVAHADYLNRFDVVTCFQVLEHVVDIHGFFKAVVDLCKPNGTIIVAVPNNAGFVGDAVNNIFNMPPHHTLLWDKRSLNYLADVFSLEVVEYHEENLSEVHRFWAFTTVINKFIGQQLGFKRKTVELGIMNRFVYILSAAIALPFSYIFRKQVSSGHSSVIVFRKKVNG